MKEAKEVLVYAFKGQLCFKYQMKSRKTLLVFWLRLIWQQFECQFVGRVYRTFNFLVLSSYILHRIVKDLLKTLSRNIKTKAVRRFDDAIIVINSKWLFLRG